MTRPTSALDLYLQHKTALRKAFDDGDTEQLIEHLKGSPSTAVFVEVSHVVVENAQVTEPLDADTPIDRTGQDASSLDFMGLAP